MTASAKAKKRVPLWRCLLITACLACATAAAQEKGSAPAGSATEPQAAPPSQPGSRPVQDQNRQSQPQPKPARSKRSPNSAASNNRHPAPPPQVAPSTAPKKVVVREGGANEPTAEIVTGMTPEQADRLRREAELLLATTAEKLREIGPRELDQQQQETVSQIHNYLEGSRSALKQADVSRAHTLALKAGLLADDLVKH